MFCRFPALVLPPRQFPSPPLLPEAFPFLESLLYAMFMTRKNDGASSDITGLPLGSHGDWKFRENAWKHATFGDKNARLCPYAFAFLASAGFRCKPRGATSPLRTPSSATKFLERKDYSTPRCSFCHFFVLEGPLGKAPPHRWIRFSSCAKSMPFLDVAQQTAERAEKGYRDIPDSP